MPKITITRKELFDLVWQEPLASLATRFAITPIELKKIYLKFNIPSPKSGHWQKVKFNKIVTVPEIPWHKIDLIEIIGCNEPTRAECLKGKRTIEYDSSVLRSRKLTNPDILTLNTKHFWSQKTNDHFGQRSNG